MCQNTQCSTCYLRIEFQDHFINTLYMYINTSTLRKSSCSEFVSVATSYKWHGWKFKVCHQGFHLCRLLTSSTHWVHQLDLGWCDGHTMKPQQSQVLLCLSSLSPISSILFSCDWTLARSSVKSKMDQHDSLPPLLRSGWTVQRSCRRRLSQSPLLLIQNLGFLLQYWWIYFCCRQYVFQEQSHKK